MDRKTKFPNGSIVEKNDFLQLYRKLETGENFGKNLKPIHFHCKGMDRQNVRLACQLLSHRVSLLFKHYFPNNVAKEALAAFIELADKVFNLLTAEKLDDQDFTRCALGGPDLNRQLQILTDFETMVTETKFYGRPEFNKGILISIQVHRQLQTKLQNDFDIPHLKTNHTTQGRIYLIECRE